VEPHAGAQGDKRAQPVGGGVLETEADRTARLQGNEETVKQSGLTPNLTL